MFDTLYRITSGGFEYGIHDAVVAMMILTTKFTEPAVLLKWDGTRYKPVVFWSPQQGGDRLDRLVGVGVY